MRQDRVLIIMFILVSLVISQIYNNRIIPIKAPALVQENLQIKWAAMSKNPGGDKTSLGNVLAQSNFEDDDVYKKFPGMEKSYAGFLPWEKDIKFLAAIKKHHTPIMMAAYKATLPDPIKAEGYNIGLAAEQLAGVVVQPNEVFSQNKAIGPYTEYRGYRAGPTYAGNQLVTTMGGGVCKIASMLYNVVTFSDLKVIMRSAHSMTVPYVPPGQDATVYYGVKDFRFMNNTSGPVLIWSQKVGDTLFMALYGCQKAPQVTWHHEIKKRLKCWTEYHYNPNLPPGTEKVIYPGQEGYVVRSWVTVVTADGMVTSKEKGTSWYSAGPSIVERGRVTSN